MNSPLRVAVLGAGPAGVYAADALVRSEVPVSVDVLDRLPAPYGLVRYGVAPDHPKIKSVSKVLARVLTSPEVRFLGNVWFGTDLHLADLRRHYDAVILATGTPGRNRLGVPGEDLPGSISAADLVDWYNAHPDADPEFWLDAREVAVIGAGNVALDAARMLATDADDLAGTDIPDHVLATLRSSKVTDIYLIARRGPAQAKFTSLELREFAKLAGAVPLVDPADLELDTADEAAVADDRRLRTNVELLRAWSTNTTEPGQRRVHFRFWQSPTAILGTDRVDGIRLRRTVPDPAGGVRATGPEESLPVQSVMTAIGYRGSPLPEIPFSAESGRITSQACRVTDESGQPLPGLYVAGWTKRGPTGVIGTNKSDAAETARTVLADATDLPPAPEPDPEAIDTLLTAREVSYVTWEGWTRLDAYETTHGQGSGRTRVKIHDLNEMIAICHEAAESRGGHGQGG